MNASMAMAGFTLMVLAGCTSQPAVDGPPKGPHGGLLADWGDCHAEFTIDHEQQRAIVHVLDVAGKEPFPLPVRQVWLTLSRPPARVTLNAWPLEDDPSGQASRFAGRMPVPTQGRKFAGSLSVILDGRTLFGEFDQQRDYKLRSQN